MGMVVEGPVCVYLCFNAYVKKLLLILLKLHPLSLRAPVCQSHKYICEEGISSHLLKVFCMNTGWIVVRAEDLKLCSSAPVVRSQSGM